jgi:TRAP-type C4-dicarboxylate transport system permease small subunit
MIERFDRALFHAVTWLAYVACAIITCVFMMIVIDVSIRTLGFTPPAFTLAVVEYALLWFAMFSAPWLVRERGHVVIEALVSVLPVIVRNILAWMVYLVCTVIAGLFAWFAFQLLMGALETMESDVRGIDMPLWAMYLPMPIGFALVTAEFLMCLIGLRSYYSYDLGEVKDGV